MKPPMDAKQAGGPLPVREGDGCAATAFTWLHGGSPYATVVCKAAFSFERGTLERRRAEPFDAAARADLAPFMPRFAVIVTGTAGYGVAGRGVVVELRDGRAPAGAQGGALMRKQVVASDAADSGPFGGSSSGFSLFEPHHPTRQARLRPEDFWSRTSKPFEFSRGFDWSFFLPVPEDQCASRPIVAGDVLVLQGFWAFGELRVPLPEIACRASLAGSDQRSRPLDMRCDTLAVDIARSQVTLTWRGSLALDFAPVGAMAEVATSAGPQSVPSQPPQVLPGQHGAPSSGSHAPVSAAQLAAAQAAAQQGGSARGSGAHPAVPSPHGPSAVAITAKKPEPQAEIGESTLPITRAPDSSKVTPFASPTTPGRSSPASRSATPWGGDAPAPVQPAGEETIGVTNKPKQD